MTFFGTGIALFSSFELFDENSSTRTGQPGASSGGIPLRTRLSASLPAALPGLPTTRNPPPPPNGVVCASEARAAWAEGLM